MLVPMWIPVLQGKVGKHCSKDSYSGPLFPPLSQVKFKIAFKVQVFEVLMIVNGEARPLIKLRTSKGDY